MLTVEIYWDDLTEEAKAKVLDALGIEEKEHNWDVTPLVVVTREG